MLVPPNDLNSDLKSNLIYGVNSDIDDQRLIEFIHEFKLLKKKKKSILVSRSQIKFIDRPNAKNIIYQSSIIWF